LIDPTFINILLLNLLDTV